MTKFMSFVDFQITEYQESRADEIVPGAKNRVLYPVKTAKKWQLTSFVDFQITVYRWSLAVEIVPVAKNRVL